MKVAPTNYVMSEHDTTMQTEVNSSSAKAPALKPITNTEQTRIQNPTAGSKAPLAKVQSPQGESSNCWYQTFGGLGTRCSPSAKRHKSVEAEVSLTWEERQEMRRNATPECDRVNLENPTMSPHYGSTIFHNLCADEAYFMTDPEYYKSLNRPSPKTSGVRTIDTRVRTIMIDWLHKVWLKFSLKEEVIYHTVNLVDRFCSQRLLKGKPVQSQEFQLLACAAMWISSKYNEIYAPEMRDFVRVSNNVFTTHQLEMKEKAILRELDFEITVPTVYTFTRRLLEVARPHLVGERQDRSRHVAMYFVEYAIHDTETLPYPPSLIAATAVYLGIVMTKSGSWFPDLEQVSGYTRSELTELTRTMRDYILDPNAIVKSVRDRYRKPEFGGVSNLVTKRG